MAVVKKIQTSSTSDAYDLASKYDVNENEITTTYATKTELNTKSNAKIRSYRSVTGTAAVTTSPYTSAKWSVTDTTVSAYEDGMVVSLKIPVAGNGSYGTVFQINSLGFKPVVYNINSMIGTRYGVGSQIICVYNSTQTATWYNNSSSSSTSTGCWQVMDYDSNSGDYNQREYYLRPRAAEAIYRYKICALDVNNNLVPMVITDQTNTTIVQKTQTTKKFRPENLYFYGSTTNTSSGGTVPDNILYSSYSGSNTCQYTFNASIGSYNMIYLKGTLDSDGLFQLDQTNKTSWYVTVPNNAASVTLSSYFTEGSYYILLGCTYSSTNYLNLFINNPLYIFKNSKLSEITSGDINLNSSFRNDSHTHTNKSLLDSLTTTKSLVLTDSQGNTVTYNLPISTSN